MVVASSCLTFRALITQAQILKKFSSSKLDKFTLFTHSFFGWNLGNRYKESVSILFRLSWHFKREKSVFWKASFCKQELITRARIRGQDFATGKNFSFNQYHRKSFALFFSRKLFAMQTLDFVSGLHNCLEFSQPLSCLYQAMQTRKTFSIAQVVQPGIFAEPLTRAK